MDAENGQTRALIEFISILPWILIVNIWSKLGYIVICDRYLVDFLATVSLRTENPLWWAKNPIGKTLLALQRKIPTIHLKITPTTATKRRKDIEYTLKELKTLTTIYNLITENSCQILNEENLKNIFEKAWNILTIYVEDKTNSKACPL